MDTAVRLSCTLGVVWDTIINVLNLNSMKLYICIRHMILSEDTKMIYQPILLNILYDIFILLLK